MIMYGAKYTQGPINELDCLVDPVGVSEYVIFQQYDPRWEAVLPLALKHRAVRKELNGYFMSVKAASIRRCLTQLGVTDTAVQANGQVVFKGDL
jgi:hypothetical protein